MKAAEAQALIADAMSEEELQANITEAAVTLGALVYHTHDSRRSEPGFPDLVIVFVGRLLFAELKKQHGRTSAEQKEWLGRLTTLHDEPRRWNGVHVFLWRPSDWLDGTIIANLRQGGVPSPS